MDWAKVLGGLFAGKAKKAAGLAHVVFVLTLLTTIVLNKKESELTVVPIVIIWGSAYLFWFVGDLIDKRIFDPLYGIDKRSWAKYARFALPLVEFVPFAKIDRELLPNQPAGVDRGRTKPWVDASDLESIRLSAARRIHPDSVKGTGIYGSAKVVYEKSDEWEEHVKPWLDISKAARTFIVPLLLIFIMVLLQRRLNMLSVRAALDYPIVYLLVNPWIAFAVLYLVVSVYLWFRIIHMAALYGLVLNARISSYVVPARPPEEPEERTIYSIDGRLIPRDQLAVFNN